MPGISALTTKLPLSRNMSVTIFQAMTSGSDPNARSSRLKRVWISRSADQKGDHNFNSISCTSSPGSYSPVATPLQGFLTTTAPAETIAHGCEVAVKRLRRQPAQTGAVGQSPEQSGGRAVVALQCHFHRSRRGLGELEFGIERREPSPMIRGRQ